MGMTTFRDELTQRAEAFRSLGHPSLEEFVVQHGREMIRKDMPADLAYGLLKECFQNAGHTAIDSDRYRYCEGFATSGVIAVHHAWLVDTEDGQAVDVTWRDGGNECGFCDDGTITVYPDEDEDGCAGECEEEICGYCGGTNKAREPHRTRENCQYMGIEFEPDEYRRLVMKAGVYDILATYAAEQDQLVAPDNQ